MYAMAVSFFIFHVVSCENMKDLTFKSFVLKYTIEHLSVAVPIVFHIEEVQGII